MRVRLPPRPPSSGCKSAGQGLLSGRDDGVGHEWATRFAVFQVIRRRRPLRQLPADADTSLRIRGRPHVPRSRRRRRCRVWWGMPVAMAMVRQLRPSSRAAAMAWASWVTAARAARAAVAATTSTASAGVLRSVSGAGVSVWDGVVGVSCRDIGEGVSDRDGPIRLAGSGSKRWRGSTAAADGVGFVPVVVKPDRDLGRDESQRPPILRHSGGWFRRGPTTLSPAGTASCWRGSESTWPS